MGEFWATYSVPPSLPDFPTLLLSATCGLLLWVVWSYVVVPYGIWQACRRQGIPTMPFRPFIGQLPDMRRFATATRNPLPPDGSGCRKDGPESFMGFQLAAMQAHGSLFLMGFGPIPRLVIADPALARQILVTGENSVYPKTDFARQTLPILGRGLVTADGELWARQRRLINPAFGSLQMKRMMAIMVGCTRDAIARWTADVARRHRASNAAAPATATAAAEFEMSRELSKLTLDIIGKSAFGAELVGAAGGAGAGSGRAAFIWEGVNETVGLSARMALSGLAFVPFARLLPLPGRAKLRARQKAIRALMLDLIRDRRMLQAQGHAGDDLLAHMMAARDNDGQPGGPVGRAAAMSDTQLMDECITFLLAGHETTSQLMTWCMYLLATHATWQQRVRDEVLRECPDGDGAPTWEQLSRLKSVHMALLESLRLYPPVPVISRQCNEKSQLGPYSLPAGISFSISIGGLHYSPQYWGDDVMDFKPERFADGVGAACTHPQAYVPFSSGARNCIGQTFALTEAKVMLAMIARNFSWGLSPGYRHCPRSFVTLRPSFGMPLLLTRLEN